jgi:hypothetical protein
LSNGENLTQYCKREKGKFASFMPFKFAQNYCTISHPRFFAIQQTAKEKERKKVCEVKCKTINRARIEENEAKIRLTSENVRGECAREEKNLRESMKCG